MRTKFAPKHAIRRLLILSSPIYHGDALFVVHDRKTPNLKVAFGRTTVHWWHNIFWVKLKNDGRPNIGFHGKHVHFRCAWKHFLNWCSWLALATFILERSDNIRNYLFNMVSSPWRYAWDEYRLGLGRVHWHPKSKAACTVVYWSGPIRRFGHGHVSPYSYSSLSRSYVSNDI